MVSEVFLENFLLHFLRGSLPLSRRKISRKTSGTRVASSIQTLQIFTVKFKSAGAFFFSTLRTADAFPVVASETTTRNASAVRRLLFQSDVKKIKGHLNKRCQCQAKPQFVSEESFSWKLYFAISSKPTFHKRYSE